MSASQPEELDQPVFDPESNLEQCRHRISEIDDQIVELLAERARVVRQVGDIKEADGLPVRDERREVTELGRVAQLADAAGVDPFSVTQIFQEIMRSARTQQTAQRTARTADKQ